MGKYYAMFGRGFEAVRLPKIGQFLREYYAMFGKGF